MTKIQIRAKKEHIDCLRPLLHKLNSYVEVHAVPMKAEWGIELVPAKVGGSRFAWQWPEEKTTEQMAWQGQCDHYLNESFKKDFAPDVTGVMIRIIKEPAAQEEKKDMSNQAEIPNLIKGEGLATFAAVTPRYRMKDLIAQEDLRKNLLYTIGILKHADLIYNTWGFGEVEDKPKIVLNFFGPPGTGKTMAAHCVAQELNKKILIANFAEIESKYVGDSPKNLENIFCVARAEEAILFFDEADSFLGKRLTSISSSSDQAVNSLRSKLLQLLEDHTGIVIFCTNLIKNYDKAFESRILRSLKFDLPDADCRKLLIRQKIPQKVPFAPEQVLNDEALTRLAEVSDGLSGREIKNVVLQVMCKVAAEERTSFTIADFEEGFTSKKQELEALKKERGGIDKAKSDQLAKNINENLQTGNFEIKKND